MIICSCALITSEDIERAVDWMRASDRDVLITPGKVYRALGKKAVCGGCARMFVQTIHARKSDELPAELQGLRASVSRDGELETVKAPARKSRISYGGTARRGKSRLSAKPA